MSLYAEYIKEKTNDDILEVNGGFATYRYVPDQGAVYIIDIYVQPELRKNNIASKMADVIAHEAKQKGFFKMFGSVIPTAKDSTLGLKVLLAYGFKLSSSAENFILLEKEI